MSNLQQHGLQNRLLARLPAEDFALLAHGLTFEDYPRGIAISQPGQPIPSIIFLECGVISLVVQTPEGLQAEGGLIGWEGFCNPAILLGVDRVPYLVEMQIPGNGHRMDVAYFLDSVGKSENLRTTLLKYTQSLIVQTKFTAASNAVHTVEERLARWLLMCHDRSQSDDLALTHKFMSVMLTVRRASVTTALQMLEGKGFIRAERGYIMVANRAGLEEFAGDAYGPPEAEYRRLLGPL